jgi:hypothetical protein
MHDQPEKHDRSTAIENKSDNMEGRMRKAQMEHQSDNQIAHHSSQPIVCSISEGSLFRDFFGEIGSVNDISPTSPKFPPIPLDAIFKETIRISRSVFMFFKR